MLGQEAVSEKSNEIRLLLGSGVVRLGLWGGAEDGWCEGASGSS